METRAYLKGTRLSPQKAGLVANAVRGKSVQDALDFLVFNKQKGSAVIKKLLESAIANAENNEKADIDLLVIKSNNIPDHSLFTNNPNCAAEQSFTFKIPKVPELLDKPIKISKEIQEVGVALNGVVLSGPYDSEGKIAIYNRKIGQCGGHADPRGMYHYHYGPVSYTHLTLPTSDLV